MFLKNVGVLSTIQLKVWGFCPRGFVHGAFVLGFFFPYPVMFINIQLTIKTIDSIIQK